MMLIYFIGCSTQIYQFIIGMPSRNCNPAFTIYVGYCKISSSTIIIHVYVKLFSTEIDQEYIFTSWSDRKPNNQNFGCACVDPNGSPPWSWTDSDCATQRNFVCLKSRQNYIVLFNLI